MPAPQFVRVNVNEALRNACASSSRNSTKSANPRITPELFLTEPLPDIDADPDLLHRAFRICTECAGRMPAGGTLTLRTSEQNGNVRIEVATRAKADSEECSRLFTRITRQIARTGLGLAIVQSWSAIITRHSVTSDEGRGTAFESNCRNAKQAMPRQPREPASESKARRRLWPRLPTNPSQRTKLPRKAHLLIVDDDPNTLHRFPARSGWRDMKRLFATTPPAPWNSSARNRST